MNRKLLLVLVASLVALVVVPSAASSGRVRGVVVKVDRAASTVAVARENGRVVVFKTGLASTAALGQRLDVHHGRITTIGHASTTRLRGVVAQSSGATLGLNANGVRLDVDRGAVVNRRLVVGARVDLVIAIDDHLTIRKVREVELEDENEVEIEDENDDDDRAAADDNHGGRGDDGRDDGDRGGNSGPGGGSSGSGGGGRR